MDEQLRRFARSSISVGQEEDLRSRIAELEAVLTRVVEHYDARSELYTSDAELAAGLAAIARISFQPTTKI